MKHNMKWFSLALALTLLGCFHDDSDGSGRRGDDLEADGGDGGTGRRYADNAAEYNDQCEGVADGDTPNWPEGPSLEEQCEDLPPGAPISGEACGECEAEQCVTIMVGDGWCPGGDAGGQ